MGEAGGGGSGRSGRLRKKNRCQTRDGKDVRKVECVFGWDVNVRVADIRYKVI